MRLFIAIELSPKQRHETLNLQHRLVNRLEGVSWVKPEALHITLKFLGDSDPQAVDDIIKVMQDISLASNTFTFNLAGLGAFPSPTRARVLWTGVQEGADELIDIASRLEESLTFLRFKHEKRPYHPHLTLGRIRRPLAEGIVDHVIDDEKNYLSDRAPVDSFILFESHLTRQGAIYKVLYKQSLL